MRLVPDRADIHNDLGFALAALGRIGEAIQHFAEATRLAPNFELAHLNFGFALAGTGRFQEAAEQFRAVLRLNPNNDDALLKAPIWLSQGAVRGNDNLPPRALTPSWIEYDDQGEPAGVSLILRGVFARLALVIAPVFESGLDQIA